MKMTVLEIQSEWRYVTILNCKYFKKTNNIYGSGSVIESEQKGELWYL